MNKPVDGDRNRLRSRMGALAIVALLATATVLARRSGVDAERLQQELLALGALAAPVFILFFAVGELLHLPGIVFVLVARHVFGPVTGFVVGYAGAVFALAVSFGVARLLVRAARATREPWCPRWAPLRGVFERLETRPVRNVAVLRLVLWLAPPLTYAVAASRVRGRDHLLGSALGILVPVVLVHVLYGALG